MLLTKYYTGDQIQKIEMVVQIAHTGFWWGNLRARDHVEDPGTDGRILLRWITSERTNFYLFLC